MAMQARQDWGTGMLKLQPHQGAKKGKAIHIDLRAGKHESLDLGTSVDEFSSSKYFTSREKSVVTEYSDSSQAKIMEVVITNPAMVSSNNILQVKEGFLVDGYNQITGAFMVHINKQQVMPQMLATTFAKFSFDFLLKTFVNVTMEGSLSLVLWHWVLFAHVSKWVAPLQGSNYTMQTWSSIGLVGMLTHECYEEKIKLASLQAGQGKEVVLLGETHSPNLDGVYTLKLNKATIEIVIYNEKEAKLFGVNLVVDRFMFSDALLSAKQVKIPWICGSQSLVSQDWKEVKLVKKIIGTQPLLTKEIQGVSTTTSEPPYYEVIANKKLLQVPLSQQRKHWLDTMRLREIEAFPEDPNNRRRWLIRKATRYKNSLEMAHLMVGHDQEEVKLRALSLVLKGKAHVWYDSLAPLSKATWSTLYGDFLNKYGHGDTPEKLWKQLLQHCQGMYQEEGGTNWKLVGESREEGTALRDGAWRKLGDEGNYEQGRGALVEPGEEEWISSSRLKLQHVKDFLQDHMDLLKLARQNVRQVQDRYKKYADEKRRQVVFKESDYVFLRVPEHLESLKTGPTPKLSPRFCDPFKMLRRAGSMAYKLELPANSRVHPVFHVSRLRQRLLRENNIIGQEVLFDFIEPPNLPHELERILDAHDLRTRHHVWHQVLVKWKDRPEEGATWENVSTLMKRFSSFVFEDENTSPRGGNVKTRVLA
ncbi:hypothetical protein L7F22_049240 [Adiantum nelumboides]|nr:hypothetical protein [Adiantum nelumboides]